MSQGWEAAAAVIGGVLLGLGFAALLGLGVASALWGGGWVWPHGTDTIGHVLGGVFSGHPGRGLPPAQARLVGPRGVVYGSIVGCELVMIAVAIGAAMLIDRHRRPGGARSGMATRGEAERVLGISRLGSAKSIIRPDLYERSSRP